MVVWLIKDGENLPVQKDSRKMRTWMLADILVSRGHEVIWWHGTFSHQRKQLLYNQDTEIEITPQFTLKLLHGGSYRTNISLKRYLHHKRVGRRFQAAAARMNRPDCIVCAFPTIDLAYYATHFAKQTGCPIVIDVRDLWPDTFLGTLPAPVRWPARLLLHSDFRRTGKVLAAADSLVAISQGCLDWAVNYAGRPQQPEDQVVYTGYPEDPQEPTRKLSPVPDYLSPHQEKVILTFIGSFGASYNLQSVCDLAQMCLDRSLNQVHFILAGDGDQYEAIRRRAQSLDNLSLTGWLSHHELKHLMAYSNIGLVPLISVKDAMPNKPFEYFSAGLPILSSLEGEMETIIAQEKVGYSYRNGDVETLFKMVKELSEDESKRYRFGRHATALFNARFRAEKIYTKYAEHIEHIHQTFYSRKPSGVPDKPSTVT